MIKNRDKVSDIGCGVYCLNCGFENEVVSVDELFAFEVECGPKWIL